MLTRTKILTMVIVLLMLLATACGTQPAGTGSQAELGTEVERADEAGHDDHTHDEDETDHKHDAAAELSAVDLAEGEKLQVVATTNIVGDLVRNVGGDMIELTTMLPVGSDPHTFTPTPQDVTAVADTDVIFINGLGLEEFLADLIENAGGEAPVVTLATGVETIALEATASHGHSDDDPHIWLSPPNAMTMVHNVEAALSALDPANAEAYEANAAAYEAQLEELDAWVMEQLAAISEKNRKIVTDHDSFGYYADHYGLEVVGAVIPNYSTNAEPSAQELAELQDAVGEYGVQAVFVGTTVNPVLAEQLATDSGIKLVPLYAGSLGETGSGVETYIDLIRYNTEVIVTALQPES